MSDPKLEVWVRGKRLVLTKQDIGSPVCPPHAYTPVYRETTPSGNEIVWYRCNHCSSTIADMMPGPIAKQLGFAGPSSEHGGRGST